MSLPAEKLLLLGPRRSLVAIHTPPAPAAEGTAPRPTVVLVNAGILHRVGPNRLHVILARRLAAEGFGVVRFDLSGIGDSEPRSDALTPYEAAMADLREALDSLAALPGMQRFVLAGLCSGADHGLLYAARDPRIAGLVMIDATLPRTRGYYLRHWGRRALRAGTWRRLLAAPVAAARAVPPGPPEADLDAVPQLTAESPEVIAVLGQAYEAVVARGVPICAVFAGAGGREYRINYREQLTDAFPHVRFGELLTLEFFQAADHTFSREHDRALLIERVSRWLAGLPPAAR